MSNAPLADAHDRSRAERELGTCFAVEAGAGAGKTTVLVTRLLELVGRGQASLGQIAAVTFTEKAAGELKMRVREELEKALDGDLDPPTREHFQQAIDDLGLAPIGTIHGFCSSLLRERPVEAGIDPQFQVADAMTATLLRERVWGEWLETELAAANPALLRALAAGVRLDGQGNTIYDVAMHMLQCRDLLDARPRPPEAEPPVQEFIRSAVTGLAELIGLVDDHCIPEPAAKFRGYMHDARCRLELAIRIGTVQAEAVVRQVNLRRQFPGKTHWDEPHVRDRAAEIHTTLRDDLEELQKAIGHDIAARVAETLLGFLAAYDRAKDDEGLLDFDDLLLVTRNMLARSREARDHFKRRYRFLLVDEFQDTDPLQAEIVFFLAERPGTYAGAWTDVDLEPGKLFIVGDPKQSIYRFRRADIEVYERAKAALGRQGDCLVLSQSFRPLRRLAELVNRIFAAIIHKPDDGLYQPDYVPLHASRTAAHAHPAVELLYPPPEVAQQWLDKDGGGDRESAATVARRAEARYAAAAIRRMVEEGRPIHDPDTGKLRPVAYRDIAILSRTFTASDVYADELARAGVPVRIVGGKHFYTAPEIHALVAVLKAVDNPHDRLSLVAAARGPFFGVSDDELLVATLGSEPALSYLRPGVSGALADAFETLRTLHQCRNSLPLPLLLQRLFEATKALELVSLWPRGEQRVANLLKIVELARALEATRRVTFRGFVRWLTHLHETQADETESPAAEASEDTVQFLTIHRAKGLEFPVVFVADTTYGGVRGNSFVVLRDLPPEEGQFAFCLGSKKLAVATANWPGDAYDKRRGEAELARLFYVATTRARDLLCLLPDWGPRRTGLIRFLNDGGTPEEPSWGEETEAGFCVDTRQLAPGDGPGRRFRVEPATPDEEPAARRLEARALWQQGLRDVLGRAQPAAVSRAPSQLEAPHRTLAEDEEPPSDEGRRIGSVVHRAIERALFRPAGLDAVLALEARREALSPDATAKARQLAATALQSPLLQRARRASACYQEVPFSLRVDAVVLTGAIDLLFIEDGAAVVVDFKTDAVGSEDELRERARAYQTQVLAYALAAHRVLCKPVREVIVFFLSAGREWAVRVTESLLGEAEARIRAGS